MRGKEEEEEEEEESEDNTPAYLVTRPGLECSLSLGQSHSSWSTILSGPIPHRQHHHDGIETHDNLERTEEHRRLAHAVSQQHDATQALAAPQVLGLTTRATAMNHVLIVAAAITVAIDHGITVRSDENRMAKGEEGVLPHITPLLAQRQRNHGVLSLVSY